MYIISASYASFSASFNLLYILNRITRLLVSTFIFFPWTCSWKFLSSWCYALLWQWASKNKSFGDSICSIYWMAQYVMPKISSFSKFGSGKCWSKAFRGEVWSWQIFWNRSTYLFCEGWFIQYWSEEIRGSGGIVGQKSNSHERFRVREGGARWHGWISR